jgi:hypothetical protein
MKKSKFVVQNQIQGVPVMQQFQSNIINSPLAAAVTGAERAAAAVRVATERLPFTVRRVEDEESLWKAVQVRHAAYARHVPEFARTLALPEDADYEDDTLVLLAESKLDGSPLGSTRIRTNTFRPLGVEQSVMLPSWLEGRRLVEATRLGVDEGRVGRLVKIALIKACFMYCEENDIDWSVATARPPVDRQYEQLMFVDVFEDKQPLPLAHVGNIAHRIMAFEIASFQSRWAQAKHPLLDFFFKTYHPDIDIGRKSAAPLARRAAPAAQPAAPVWRDVHDLAMV